MNKNIKKIIKAAAVLGLMMGAAYVGYKCGVSDGESNERKRRLREIEDDDLDDYLFDEPDDDCISPYNIGEK